ncbi:peptidase M16 domain protein [Chitinispirillum alkaliphilum]|nr:peptidase M16 domain protein [Chitinispirillum alkaliphilum]
MRKTLLALIASALLFSLSAQNIEIPVNYHTLDNGLRVIIVPDPNVAEVSCRLYYFVGGMNEGPGTTGLSHMYEHMMFKGTKTLGTSNYEKEIPFLNAIDSLDAIMQTARLSGAEDSVVNNYRAEIFELLEQQREYINKDEIWELYRNHGGTRLNAWTSNEMTAYIVTLPQNKTELFYWIESDRMENPVLREFHSELEVVIEERKMRYDNRPLHLYWERLNSLFFVAHPYRQPVIGWESDIRAYTPQKLMRYINQYYTPENALIVLVGNVDPESEFEKIERYFGHIPKSDQPADPVVTREPTPIGQTRLTVHSDVEPRVDILFHTPGYPHEDLYALDIIQGILSGRTGRLYRRLVDTEELCVNAGAFNSKRLHNGYFHVWAQLKEDSDPKLVEKIILEELAKLIDEKPSSREMLRITNQIRFSFAEGLKSLEGLSDRLARFERLGSWQNLLEYPEKISRVGVQNIPYIASFYLIPELATIGYLLPDVRDDMTENNEKTSE